MVSRITRRPVIADTQARKQHSFGLVRVLHKQAQKIGKGNNETIRLAGLMPTHMIELLDKLPEMVHIIDRSGRIVYINNQWQTRLGRTEETTVGSSIFDHLPADQREAAIARFRIKLAGGKVEKVIDRAYLTKDGKKVYVNTSDHFLRDQKGEVALIITVLQDITQVKRMAAQAAVNSIMGVIARGFGENLRNMLMPIDGQASYIQILAKDGQVKELAANITAATKRTKDFINRFVVLAQWRAGDIDVGKHDLRLVLGNSFGIYDHILRGRVALSAKAEEIIASPIVLQGDIKVLGNVLAELYKNGVEAGGEVTLEVEPLSLANEIIDDLRNVLKPGEYLHFTVRDTGSGINHAVRNDIFKLFFTQKPQEDHTGLGLSLVYAGVTAHKGGIMVESEEGAGTAFHLYIPVVYTNGNGQ